MTTHDPAVFRAGDRWEIEGSLLAVDGTPLDITSYTIEWRLSSLLDQNALDEDEVTITVVDAVTGKIRIIVAASDTHQLEPGHYQDALRITNGSTGPMTMWTGSILVEPNLFSVIPVVYSVEGADVSLMSGTVT